ncbi:hypothetical protein [Halostella pelagica]|uniref:hypothetical protein n=1 Tax=Halostella pelagica TaxID=2583824 RepID=UPI001080A74E|nr:hypothetical protein [Halostella pelagica]
MTMVPSPTDEDVLNVFRELDEPYEHTLTTNEVTEEFPVQRRAVQGYVKDLEGANRLVLDHEGKPNHWRLARTEPSEPVYDPRLGKAKRWGNKAKFVGNWTTLFGIAILAAVGIITSNHVFSAVADIGLPMSSAQSAITAGLTGVLGSGLFLIGFAAYIFSFSVPRLAEWWINRTSCSDAE